MTSFVGLILLASSCLLARSSSGCAASLSDLLSLCDAGQYLDTRTCACRNCTYFCPANQIVRRLCSPVSDSVCGPFFANRQQKTKKKKKKMEELTTEDWQLAIGDQGLVYSANGARSNGDIPLYVVDTNAITVRPFVNQLSDATDKMRVHSRVYVALLISAAAAAFLILVAAVSTIVFVTSRKKTKTQRRTVASSGVDYSRILVSPDERTSANRPADRSVIHIESQLIWNSQRGRGTASLLGRSHSGNDYVRECDQKAALSTFNAPN